VAEKAKPRKIEVGATAAKPATKKAVKAVA
jgi:hypothetical protein